MGEEIVTRSYWFNNNSLFDLDDSNGSGGFPHCIS